MEESEFKPVSIKDMDKCAIIYRDDSASFVYVCYHCGATFTDIDCTLQHIESHFQLVEVTFVESNCKDLINSTAEAIDTIQDPDIDIDIKTEIIKSEDDCDLLENATNFDCKLCDSVFLSKFSVRCHMLRVHFKEEVLECEKCNKSFKRDLSFENHLRQHIQRGEVSWDCEGDGIREPAHVKSPEQQDNRKSDILQIPDKAKDVPKKKKQIASKKEKQVRRYNMECHKCSEVCKTPIDLNDHLKSHRTDDMMQTNRCKKCNSFFQSGLELRLHVLEVHLPVKKFKCSSCLVEFNPNEKKQFEKHLEVHLASKAVNWTDICEGILSQEKDLTSFEQITTCIEQYACDFCEDKFYLKSNLDEHKRIKHSKHEHELHCPQCGCVFTQLKVSTLLTKEC